jgi:hypothetical protein
MIRGGRGGYERLLVLARERWPDTAALFDRAGLVPGCTASISAAVMARSADEAAALGNLQPFTADPRTLICGPRVFQSWSRR